MRQEGTEALRLHYYIPTVHKQSSSHWIPGGEERMLFVQLLYLRGRGLGYLSTSS